MFIEWHAGMSVGADIIDDEHKILIKILNELHDMISDGSDPDAAMKIFSDARSYCNYHFSHEEALFTQTAYPDAESHKYEHERIRGHIHKLAQSFANEQKSELMIALMVILKSWFIEHVQGTDSKFVPFLTPQLIDNYRNEIRTC